MKQVTILEAHLGEGLGDPGLDVVSGCAEMLADLGHQAGSKVPECPVIVHIWSQAQLSAHNAGHHSWNQLVDLGESGRSAGSDAQPPVSGSCVPALGGQEGGQDHLRIFLDTV